DRALVETVAQPREYLRRYDFARFVDRDLDANDALDLRFLGFLGVFDLARCLGFGFDDGLRTFTLPSCNELLDFARRRLGCCGDSPGRGGGGSSGTRYGCAPAAAQVHAAEVREAVPADFGGTGRFFRGLHLSLCLSLSDLSGWLRLWLRLVFARWRRWCGRRLGRVLLLDVGELDGDHGAALRCWEPCGDHTGHDVRTDARAVDPERGGLPALLFHSAATLMANLVMPCCFPRSITWTTHECKALPSALTMTLGSPAALRALRKAA